MKTLSDRKIAEEQQATFTAQKLAQEKRQEFEKSKAVADMQPQMVAAGQGVEIAEKNADAEIKRAAGAAKSVELTADAQAKATRLTASAEAERITVTGNAEAQKIRAIGQSTAEAYKQQVDAMGQNNFATFKITESIGANKIKVTPDVLVTGGGSGGSSPLDGLLACFLQEKMTSTLKDNAPAPVNNPRQKGDEEK